MLSQQDVSGSIKGQSKEEGQKLQKVTTKKKTELRKKALLTALEKSLGIVTTACKATSISRQTFYRWIEEDPEFAKAFHELDNVALDFGESHLFQQIKNDVPASTIFFLKTRGKKRGYFEKVETQVTHAHESMTDEQLNAEIERFQKISDETVFS